MDVLGLDFVTVIGIIAGAFTAVSMLPQLIKILKTKDVSGVSLGMLLILTAGVMTWVYYGILQEDWPVIVTNSFSTILNLITLYCKIRFK